MQTQVKSQPIEKMPPLSRGKKMLLIVFVIWAAQAIPKWTLAITADGETAAKIVGIFITPKAEQSIANNETEVSSLLPFNT